MDLSIGLGRTRTGERRDKSQDDEGVNRYISSGHVQSNPNDMEHNGKDKIYLPLNFRFCTPLPIIFQICNA